LAEAEAALMGDVEVLIVGAGPTGLVLALSLARLGVRLRIIDKLAAPAVTSRALAVHARTLEFYRQLGLADHVVERGQRAAAANLWVAGRNVARVAFADMGAGISPYPFTLIYPQDEHERLLIRCLDQQGVVVERQTELVRLEEDSGRVVAHLATADGSASRCDARFVAGCDGAHSTVRQAAGIRFGGGTYEHLFYVADVDARGRTMNGEVHVALDTTDFLAVFPLRDAGRARFVGTVREGAIDDRRELAWDDVSPRVMEWLDVAVSRVNWFSTYRVHHRVADRFRSGQVFLLGDAAHIHSPVGGQGMNTGIGDAVNLAWKIAGVLRNGADAAILDTYEPERIAFARRLVATTDEAFTVVTSSGRLARILRLRVVPRLLPVFFATAAARRLAFRTVSQTSIHYRDSWLSEGRAGALRGGDRLPWVLPDDDRHDNFEPLQALAWQVHIYGDVASEIRALCEARRLPLHTFTWRPAMRGSGLRQNALYLVRPDGYLAFVDERQTTASLGAYLDARRIISLSAP
jgi:2-polyprenyl-6-methoxyphenol hydroxylase-like FAD-dependent oxidoreductase